LPGARRIEHRFEDLLRRLGVRLITYDRPGYGRSDRHPGRSVADSASDVATVADAVGLADFAVEGGSSGSAHALAVAALLGSRALRLACVAPMAPFDQLGAEEWSRGQRDAVRQYVAWCLEGEDRLAKELSREDSEMRTAAQGDPNQVEVIEQTRNGLSGWIDDELSVLQPWGFDCASISVPTTIWYDPDEPVLPHQHAQWLARTVPHAELVTTTALGHRSEGDPAPDWTRLYSWLIDSR
jgi:pimeloyl-ACP methyl ester carboxylesterase